jgi:adenine C2-methylase RlmN of 23S rRNA A2503 and tRNA A37
MGLKAQLTAGEIVEQLVHALRLIKLRNIVFMGMGEPLDNYTNVKVHKTSFCKLTHNLSSA